MQVADVWKWMLGSAGLVMMSLGSFVLQGVHARVKTLEFQEHENTGRLASLNEGQENINRWMERTEEKNDRWMERIDGKLDRWMERMS